MKRFLVILLGSICSTLPLGAADRVLPAPGDDGFIYFTANEASVEPSQKIIQLFGDVQIIQKAPDGSTRTITGDQLKYDQLNTEVSSEGLVHVEDSSGNQLEANNILFNYTTKDFKADSITTQYPPLRILSAKQIRSKNGKKILKKATVTCCDKPDPHYTLSVGRLSVSPHQKIFGTNAVLRLDDIPVLWLPVFWRSFDSQKPWTTYVDFTQSNRTGWGILTTTAFPAVLQLRPKLILDYYTKSGLGIGTEITAVESPTVRGSGEFYYINDQADYKDITIDDKKRWGMQGGYWWEMHDSSDHFNSPSGALYQFQTQFRMVSDPYFYDSFFRSNPYVFMPDQETNFSFSRQTRRSTLRLSYQQKDIFAWDKQEFMAEKRSLPEIKYELLPFNDPWLLTSNRLEVDFNNTSSLEYKDGMPNEEGPYKRQAHAKWTTEKSFRLNKHFTLLPQVFYDQTVTFADEKNNKTDAWVARVGTDINLRTRSFLGSTDIGYQFTKRLSTGTLTSDHESLDRGIERSHLYLKNYYRPSLNTYVRFETGFNLSDTTTNLETGYIQELTWEHLKTRIEPLTIEWGYNSPNGKINFFMRDMYDIADKNIHFIAQSNFMIKNQNIGLGVNNFANHTDPGSLYQTQSDRYTFTTTWGIRPPSDKWKLDLGLDVSLFRDSWYGFNKLARLTYIFHDARLELTARDRNHNLSFAFRINILCGTNPREQQQKQDSYWYPWRQQNDLRD